MSAGGRGPGSGIDWDEVRAMLDRASAAPEEARAREVLDARARALARVPARPPDASESLDLATFTLDDERFAIETRYVRRIARLGPYERVPGTPAALLGVTNAGGEILALFDLRLLFGGRGAAPTDRSRVVVLGDGRDEFGVLADAAHEVLTLRLGELLPPPNSSEGHGPSLLRGVTADAMLVIDGGLLLRDDRLVVDQRDEPGAEAGARGPS